MIRSIIKALIRGLFVSALLFLALRPNESTLLIAAQASTPSTLADDWTWPLKSWSDFEIKQNIGSATFPGKSADYHPGIDVLKRSEKPQDTQYLPVYAAADGVVSYLCNSDKPEVLDCQGFGKAVLIRSTLPANLALPDGATTVTSIYGHLQTNAQMPIAKPGTQVKKGVTIIGYIADQQHCGDTCNGPHLHFGIREGYLGDGTFPSGNWGYFPLTMTNEIKKWENPVEFIMNRQLDWRTQTERSTGFLAWTWTFGVCDASRRMKVYLDNKLIFYTSVKDGPNPSSSATLWVWPGDHTYKIETFDYRNAPPIELSWALAPLGPVQPVSPACASEAISGTPTIEPNNDGSNAPTATSGIELPITTATPYSNIPAPVRPVKVFFDAFANDDIDTAINQCFAPQHQLLARPLLKAYESARNDQGLNLSFSNMNYKIASIDGQKGIVSVTGIATSRDKNGSQSQFSFDVDVPVFNSLSTWYIDLDLQRLQQLLDQMSR